jgi:uncharacterized protein
VNTKNGSAERLAEIDALRGFALFGVFGANLPLFSGLAYSPEAMSSTSGMDAALAFGRLWLVETKFMGLFSMLFGYSFWLFLRALQARGEPSLAPFFRRIGWLFVFGAVHGWVFWCWDILRFYALWALLLPLCLAASPRRLLVVSVGFAFVVPAMVAFGKALLMPVEGADDAIVTAFSEASRVFSTGTFLEAWRTNWQLDWAITLRWGQLSYQATVFGYFLMGLAAARYFGDAGPAAQPGFLAKVWWWTAPTGIVIGWVLAAGGFHGGGLPDVSGALAAAHAVVVAQLGNAVLTVAWASGFLWLTTRPRARRWLLKLAPVGRMALSLYLLQSLLGLLLFYGWTGGPGWMGQSGWMGQWTERDIAAWWVVGFALQVWLANLWLRHHAQGPMEWLWRSLTWWRLQSSRASARG